MTSRSVWSGFIRFGLVSVPVKAYTATASGGGGISLNQLHGECNSRINYKKMCPVHGEIAASEIVSGYEFTKGQYVVVDPAEIDKLRTQNEKAIDVQAFVAPDQIDARYFSGKTWYLLPDGPIGLKPYSLLAKVLKDQNLAGFAQVVVGGKVQLILLRPIDNVLVGSYLSYSSELKALEEFRGAAPQVEVAPDELKLAKTLTDAMTVEDFDLGEYKDDYTEKLRQLIEAKIEGKQVVAPESHEEAPQTINLMDALKRSLDEAKSKAVKRKPPMLEAPSTGANGAAKRKRKTS